MNLLYSIRRRIRGWVAPSLAVLAVLYFAYHAIQGERGLISYMRLDFEVRRAEANLTIQRRERERMERRVALLHPDHVDPDMLDERVRSVLGLARPDELVIFTK